MNLELHATPDEVMRAVDALREFGEQQGVPDRVMFGLALALEECASNVVNHALGHDPERSFRVGFECTDDTLSVELRDDGPPFDPTAIAATEPVASDEREPGGWGVQLARRHVTEMHYAREGDVNVLRFSSWIHPVP
jgi:serine/threonine-protein kinase RsbW